MGTVAVRHLMVTTFLKITVIFAITTTDEIIFDDEPALFAFPNKAVHIEEIK
jgi:hypothetical protein